jgi:hypothetical protein
MLLVYNVKRVVQKIGSFDYFYMYFSDNLIVLLASEKVRLSLALRYWDTIMNYFNPISQPSPFQESAMRKLFEIISIVFLTLPSKMNAYLHYKSVHHQLTLSKGCMREIPGSWQDFLKTCARLPTSTQQQNQRELLVPDSSNQPVVDMMDSCDRAYQITTGNDHDIKLHGLLEMVDTLNLSPQKPLHLYFVILEEKLEKFGISWKGSVKSLNVTREKHKKKIWTDDELKSCVRSCFICIPKHPGPEIIGILQEFEKGSK